MPWLFVRFGVASLSDGRSWITVNQLESESVGYQYAPWAVNWTAQMARKTWRCTNMCEQFMTLCELNK